MSKSAEALEAQGKWGEAAEAWRVEAESFAAAGRSEEAADAAGRAADGYRRDDRPAASARMLRLALQNRPATVRDAVLLAGALLDAGEIEAAVNVAHAAADGAAEEPARVLALDVYSGALLAAGRVPEATQQVRALKQSPVGGAALSAGFRGAQLARLEGDLGAAEAGWRALVGMLTPHPAAAGALAAAWMELGEVALLRVALRAAGVEWVGAPTGSEAAESEACFAAASQAWARAGRRAGFLRAEAWRVRARAAPNALPGVIDTAVSYAEERGLLSMEADARCVRAVVARQPLDALHAVELLRQAPMGRGRARLLAAELGAPLNRELAFAELVHDVAWRARLERFLARADFS